MICPTGKAEYFSQQDWTTQITLIELAFSSFCRIPDVASVDTATLRRWCGFAAVRRKRNAPLRYQAWRPRNDFRAGQLGCRWPGDLAMSDETRAPPFVYDGLDPVPEPRSALAEVAEALKDAVRRLGDAIDAGKKPGRPLSILSNIAREAPLGSLLIAFLLGVAVGRRR
jgi:hypothetical protein